MEGQELNELKLKLIKAVCELEDKVILLQTMDISIGTEPE